MGCGNIVPQKLQQFPKGRENQLPESVIHKFGQILPYQNKVDIGLRKKPGKQIKRQMFDNRIDIETASNQDQSTNFEGKDINQSQQGIIETFRQEDALSQSSGYESKQVSLAQSIEPLFEETKQTNFVIETQGDGLNTFNEALQQQFTKITIQKVVTQVEQIQIQPTKITQRAIDNCQTLSIESKQNQRRFDISNPNQEISLIYEEPNKILVPLNEFHHNSPRESNSEVLKVASDSKNQLSADDLKVFGVRKQIEINAQDIIEESEQVLYQQNQDSQQDDDK